MKIPRSVTKLTLPVIALFSIFSCTKDTDLLADYVISDTPKAKFFVGLVQDDVFFSSKDTSMILDVLANDGFTDPDKVKIIEVTQPFNGSVVINEDKTLTYTPGGDPTSVTANENDTEQEPSENESAAPTEQATPTVGQQPEPKTDSQPESQPKPETQPKPDSVGDTQESVKKDESQNNTESEQGQEKVTEENKDEQATDDNFGYKVEVSEDDGKVTEQEGTVTITTKKLDYGVLKAFPTAYGAGSNASGGRGGSVYRVTNLENSGKGSFRDAVSQSNRFVVFDVSGTVRLTSGLSITADNLTIAGQTAPKGGISITGPRIRFIDVDNLIVRYVRFRPIWDQSKHDIDDAVECTRVTNAIFDHISVSWGPDEAISFVGSVGTAPNKRFATHSITLQNSFITDSAKGMIVGFSNYQDKNTKGTTGGNFSVNNNVFAHCSHRFPNPVTHDRVDVVNNVVHDWRNKAHAMNPPSKIKVNYINNYYQKGNQISNVLKRGKMFHLDYDKNEVQSIYAAGNIVQGEFTDSNASNIPLFHWWTVGPSGSTTGNPTSTQQVTSANASGRFADKPFPQINNSFTVKTAQETLSALPNEVGAYAVINSKGDKVFNRDVIDEEFISNVQNNAGITHDYYQDRSKTSRYINYYKSVSTTPLNRHAANRDTDGDGMPDSWEISNYGNLNQSATDDFDSDGYDNIEQYINLIDF